MQVSIDIPITANLSQLLFQKQQIVKRLDILSWPGADPDVDEVNALNGILNILDHIQDTIAEQPDVTEEDVFGPKCSKCGEFQTIHDKGSWWSFSCHNTDCPA